MQLAYDIEQCIYDYDPYSYIDDFGSRENGLYYIQTALMVHDITEIKQILTDIAEDEDDFDSIRESAFDCLKQIGEFNGN